jgi:hypothetical protein
MVRQAQVYGVLKDPGQLTNGDQGTKVLYRPPPGLLNPIVVPINPIFIMRGDLTS